MREFENSFHHLLDLVFIRPAVTGESHFNLEGSVFEDGNFILAKGQLDNSPGLADDKGGFGIGAPKETF